MKKIAIISLALLSTQWVMGDYTSVAKIRGIYTYTNTIIIHISNSNSTGCKYDNYVALQDINNKNKAMFATIMSAYISSKEVRLGFDKNQCKDTWGDNSMVDIYSANMTN